MRVGVNSPDNDNTSNLWVKNKMNSEFPKLTAFDIVLTDKGYGLVAALSGKALDLRVKTKQEALQYAISKLWLINYKK